jgi:hypothetical protein
MATATYSFFQLSGTDTENLIHGSVSDQAFSAVSSILGYFPTVENEVLSGSGGGTVDPPAGTNVLFDYDYNGTTTVDEPNSMFIVAGAGNVDLQLNTTGAPGSQTLVLGNQTPGSNLSVTADAGAATIFGGAGSNLLSAGTQGGNHELLAGSGLSTMWAGSGADSLVSGSGNSTMFGGTGSSPTDFFLAGGISSVASGSSVVTAGGPGPQNVDIGNATSNNVVFGNGTDTIVQFTGQSSSDITAKTTGGVTTVTFDDTKQTDTLTGVTQILDEHGKTITPT